MSQRAPDLQVARPGDKSLSDRLDELEDAVEGLKHFQSFQLGIVACAGFILGAVATALGLYLTWKQ